MDVDKRRYLPTDTEKKSPRAEPLTTFNHRRDDLQCLTALGMPNNGVGVLPINQDNTSIKIAGHYRRLGKECPMTEIKKHHPSEIPHIQPHPAH